MKIRIRNIRTICLVFLSLSVGSLLALLLVNYRNPPVARHISSTEELTSHAVAVTSVQSHTESTATLFTAVTKSESHPFSQSKETHPPMSDPFSQSKETHPPMSDDPIQVMNYRKRLLETACDNYKGPIEPIIANQPLYSAKYSLYYCPVEKIASTFWRRFFYQLEYTFPVKSPFDVRIPVAFRNMHIFSPRLKYDNEFNALLKSSTKMIFVRDPYSRLFSAFVDKLVAPNPAFWQAWGQPAIVHFRNKTNHDNLFELCGDDVTFLEFIREAIANLWKKDVHVMPIFRLCSPCSVSYDIIGQMDTFQNDASVVVNSIGIDPKLLRLDALRSDATADAIKDSATDPLSAAWLRSTIKCITMDDAVRRIWRKLQLRGLISWRRKFPFTDIETRRMESSKFIRILKNESLMSQDTREMRLQKRQAMLEAFVTLTPREFKDLDEIFELDFKVFGFDVSHFRNLGRLGVEVKNTYAFDWRRDWDLSSVL